MDLQHLPVLFHFLTQKMDALSTPPNTINYSINFVFLDFGLAPALVNTLGVGIWGQVRSQSPSKKKSPPTPAFLGTWWLSGPVPLKDSARRLGWTFTGLSWVCAHPAAFRKSVVLS